MNDMELIDWLLTNEMFSTVVSINSNFIRINFSKDVIDKTKMVELCNLNIPFMIYENKIEFCRKETLKSNI